MQPSIVSPPRFAPVRDVALFLATTLGFALTWRLTGSPVTCTTWVAALFLGVVLFILDTHRRGRGRVRA